MKVVVLNGSARKNGNTSIALGAAAEALRERGVETERIDIGDGAIHGCVGCGRCFEKRDRRCVFDGDVLNRHLDALFAADGLLVGSPVYYAGINGALKCFLDRAFFVGAANGGLFRHKVGAGVVAVRRGGEAAAWEQLNKYFTIAEMFVPSSTYWNMVFGLEPGEARRDAEGMETMRTLGANMAWLLQCRAANAASLPPPGGGARTNFIR